MSAGMTQDEQQFAQNLGAWLFESRSKLGLSQRAMAVVAGCHRNAFWRWENGLSMPNPHQLSKLRAFVKSKAVRA